MTSIQEMMDAAEEGAVITLTEDCTESAVMPSGKSLTIDLGGHTWKGEAGKPTLTVYGATAKVRNGTIYQDGQKTFQVGDKDATLDSILYLDPSLTVRNYNYVAVFVAKKAYVYTSATIIAENGTCIQGNGTAPYFDNLVCIEGGSLTATGDDMPLAIYWPQRGDLTIKAGRLEADTAVELRAGKLTILGGEFVGTGSYKVTPNGSGSTTSGAAVAIAQHTTQLPIEVRVSGGTFTAQVPFSEANPQGNPASATGKISLSVTGGTFEGTLEGSSAVVSADCKGFVSGGVLTRIDNAYIDPSSDITTEGGKVVIRPKSLSGTPMFISDSITQGAASSTSQGRLIGSVNEFPTGADAVKGNLVYYNVDKCYYRCNGTEWTEEVPGFSATSLDGSDRPIASSVVTAEVARLDGLIDNRYTKAETDKLLQKKQDLITGAASSITTEQLTTGRVLVSDNIGKVAASEITAAQIDKLKDIDESKGTVQAQIDRAQATADRKVEQEAYDAKMSSVDAAIAENTSKIDAVSEKVDAKQDKLIAGENISISGDNVIKAIIPEAAKPDSAMSDTSENAVQNKVIKAAIDEVDAKFGKYYTKVEATAAFLGKAETAQRAIADEQGNNIAETYALKADITRVFRFMGTCTSAELDKKEQVVGHVWNLSDSRDFDGKTFKAGTSWLGEYDGTGAFNWEPQTPMFDVDLSGYQKKDVRLERVTVTSWEDSGIETYPYRGKLADTAFSATDVATVVFGITDAISGDYAPVCETADEAMYIYSKKNTGVTLELVEIRKG